MLKTFYTSNYSGVILIVIVGYSVYGYGGLLFVNTTVVVVEEKNILNSLRPKYNTEDEKISISLFYQYCDNIYNFFYKYSNNNCSKYE